MEGNQKFEEAISDFTTSYYVPNVFFNILDIRKVLTEVENREVRKSIKLSSCNDHLTLEIHIDICREIRPPRLI